MSRPKNPKLKKTTHHVAMRAAAVRGVATAFPHMPSAEIARALGLTRDAVKHYLLGGIKSAENQAPHWQAAFIDACRQLASEPSRAADKFERLARELYRHSKLSAEEKHG